MRPGALCAVGLTLLATGVAGRAAPQAPDPLAALVVPDTPLLSYVALRRLQAEHAPSGRFAVLEARTELSGGTLHYAVTRQAGSGLILKRMLVLAVTGQHGAPAGLSERDEVARVAAFGVDGVITDRPELYPARSGQHAHVRIARHRRSVRKPRVMDPIVKRQHS